MSNNLGSLHNLTVGQRGILTRAQQAGKNYQEAAKREDEELANFWAEAENIIQGNTGGSGGGGTTPTPPEGGETPDPVTPTQPEPSEEVKALKAGDYIKYDTGVEGIGVITCRVLYPVDSEYGLQIISDKNVELIKIGKKGATWEESKREYNGVIKKLNDAAEKYVNKAYAYDGRCVGSIPTMQNGMFVDKNKVRDSEGNIRDTLDTVSIPETWKVPSDWDGNRDTGCYEDRSLYFSDGDSMALARGSMLKTGENYWLATRGSNVNSQSNVYYSTVTFSISWVNINGGRGSGYLCYVQWNGDTFSPDVVADLNSRSSSLYFFKSWKYKDNRWRWNERSDCIYVRNIVC